MEREDLGIGMAPEKDEDEVRIDDHEAEVRDELPALEERAVRERIKEEGVRPQHQKEAHRRQGGQHEKDRVRDRAR
jgi:hypothetical protein